MQGQYKMYPFSLTSTPVVKMKDDNKMKILTIFLMMDLKLRST